MKTIDHYYKGLKKVCDEGRIWTTGKSLKEVVDTCPRGDWLFVLYFELTEVDPQKFTLVKAHVAKTVYHLMKDKISRRSVNTALRYGEGKATIEQLTEAREQAHKAMKKADDVYLIDNNYPAYSAACAAYSAAAIRDNSTALLSSCAYLYGRSVDLEDNRMEAAEIFRKYLPFKSWKVKPI